MRAAGILLHPTSLPGPGPCGDLGPAATAFLDWLEAAGCRLWQVLPLNPVDRALSPYASPSAMAGATHLISVDALVDDGLLTAAEVADRPGPVWRDGQSHVNVAALHAWHAPLVARAGARLAAEDPAAIDAFRARASWVDSWALYSAICGEDRAAGWWAFPQALRDREPVAMDRARDQHAAATAAIIAQELLFERQWGAVRAAAEARGITLVGDVPIFVGGNSVDAWEHRALFRWGTPCADGSPRLDPVTGVPPDYFSPLGQVWGTAHYDWPAHARTDWTWWRERFAVALARCHALRVDHFRGFAGAWAIPAGKDGADADARNGAWEPGPGAAPFDALARDLGPDQPLPLLAEDLGHITADVKALRAQLGLPGMKVLQFGFGPDPHHPFRPHTFDGPGWAVYTGTHDNDTSVGWFNSTDEPTRHRLRVYAGRDGSEPGWDLIRLAWASTAQWAVAPLQDVLGLGSEARLNTPGVAQDNWTWRAAGLPDGAAHRLGTWSHCYGRTLPTAPDADDETPPDAGL